MTWHSANRGDICRLMKWLRRNEWQHIALSSQLKRNDVKTVFGRIVGDRLWIGENEGKVGAALFISHSGVVLPALGDGRSDEITDDFLDAIISSHRNRIHSVIGMEDPVMEIERRMNRLPPDMQNYRMFVRSNPTVIRMGGIRNLAIRRATHMDADALWPLEKAYQIEEVLREGNYLNESSVRTHLIRTLREQEVYMAISDGIPIAKAGTNAQGIGYDQIGGVFVDTRYRNRGVAACIVQQLLQSIAERGKKACLFVKDSNAAALRLYRNLGFQDRGTFRISYWI